MSTDQSEQADGWFHSKLSMDNACLLFPSPLHVIGPRSGGTRIFSSLWRSHFIKQIRLAVVVLRDEGGWRQHYCCRMFCTTWCSPHLAWGGVRKKCFVIWRNCRKLTLLEYSWFSTTKDGLSSLFTVRMKIGAKWWLALGIDVNEGLFLEIVWPCVVGRAEFICPKECFYRNSITSFWGWAPVDRLERALVFHQCPPHIHRCSQQSLKSCLISSWFHCTRKSPVCIRGNDFNPHCCGSVIVGLALQYVTLIRRPRTNSIGLKERSGLIVVVGHPEKREKKETGACEQSAIVINVDQVQRVKP